MDTSTSYLGLKLPHPFIAGASPMGYSLDTIKRLEDAGCAAIVLHSLFEEQISLATDGRVGHVDPLDEQMAGRVAAYPAPADYKYGPDGYANHIAKIKQAVRIPVIASLNGHSGESWLQVRPRHRTGRGRRAGVQLLRRGHEHHDGRRPPSKTASCTR